MVGGVQTPSLAKDKSRYMWQKRAEPTVLQIKLGGCELLPYSLLYYMPLNPKMTHHILTHNMKCGWCITQQQYHSSQKAVASNEFAPAWA